MAHDYIIRTNYETQWLRGQSVSGELRSITQDSTGRSYLPVHGDAVLSQLTDHDLVCYFVYTLSSWWEIPLIDRIISNRKDNNFAIIMDVNPAPETMYRLERVDLATPETRYKSGLREIFTGLESDVADAMFNSLRNGFGHNLFGREPGKLLFDNEFHCPPLLNRDNVLLVPPIQLALSMVTAFLSKIAMLLVLPASDRMRIFRTYMTGQV